MILRVIWGKRPPQSRLGNSGRGIQIGRGVATAVARLDNWGL